MKRCIESYFHNITLKNNNDNNNNDNLLSAKKELYSLW